MMILRRVVSTFYTNMLCYLGSKDRCNYWLCSLDVDNDNDVHDVDDDDDNREFKFQRDDDKKSV